MLFRKPTSDSAVENTFCQPNYCIYCVKASFQEVLLIRLSEALAQREEMMGSPKEWVGREAKKRQALQEGGTLR